MPRPYLARSLKMRWTSPDPETLKVTDYTGAVTIVTRDSKMKNSTKSLPLCVAILNRFVQNADELLAKQNQK